MATPDSGAAHQDLQTRLGVIAAAIRAAEAKKAAALAQANDELAALKRELIGITREMDLAEGRPTDDLRRAALDGDAAAITAALDAGANPNRMTPATPETDEESLSPLMLVASVKKPGHVAMATTLLGRGADPNQATTDAGITALMQSVTSGDCEMTALLLDAGADPNQAASDNGQTALMIAATLGADEVGELLLRRGADVNQGAPKTGLNAIHLAAEAGRASFVALLLRYSANPDAERCDTGGSALMGCAHKGFCETATVLLNGGANPNAIRIDNGDSALIAATRTGKCDVIRLLLQRGADPNQAASNGGTPSMMAAARGHVEVLQLLAAFGADMTIEMRQSGMDTRNMAVSFGRDELVLWLDAVASWHPLEIATACRLFGAARTALWLGRIDTAGCGHHELTRLAVAPESSLWAGSPVPTPGTAALVSDVMTGWTPAPSVRRLFHAGFRDAVHHLLLLAERLRRRAAAVEQPRTLSVLPTELWLIICGFMLRQWWLVVPPGPPGGLPSVALARLGSRPPWDLTGVAEHTYNVDETGLGAHDIELVILQAGVSRSSAVGALRKHDGDVVGAIMDLTMGG